jgi:hypothetical protein
MTNLPKNDYVNAFKPERPAGRFVSAGVHAPEGEGAAYAPSNPLAWGPKGEWGPKKSWEAVTFEAQIQKSESYVTQDGARARAAHSAQRAASTRAASALKKHRTPRARARARTLPARTALTRARMCAARACCRVPQRPVHVGGARQAERGYVSAEPLQHCAAPQKLEAQGANLLVRPRRRAAREAQAQTREGCSGARMRAQRTRRWTQCKQTRW